jgi:arylsulfatase A
MPTLAALAGASRHLPRGIDGISFVPTLLAQGRQQRHAFLYWEYTPIDWKGYQSTMRPDKTLFALRLDQWKAVRTSPNAPIELYDLKHDIGERHNVAGQQPKLAARIEKLLRQARTDYREQLEPEMPEGRKYR